MQGYFNNVFVFHLRHRFACLCVCIPPLPSHRLLFTAHAGVAGNLLTLLLRPLLMVRAWVFRQCVHLGPSSPSPFAYWSLFLQGCCNNMFVLHSHDHAPHAFAHAFILIVHRCVKNSSRSLYRAKHYTLCCDHDLLKLCMLSQNLCGYLSY